MVPGSSPSTDSKPGIAWPVAVLGVAAIALAVIAPFPDLMGARFGPRRLVLTALGVALCAASVGSLRTRGLAQWRAIPRVSPAEFLATAMWMGLVTGFFEVGHHGCRRYVFGTFIKHTEMVLWAAPLVHLVVFTGLGLVMMLAAAVARPLVNRATVGFVLLAFGAWTQILSHAWLSRWAALILIVALGVQGARVAAAHWERIVRLRRWTRIPLVGLFAAGLFGVPIYHSMVERSAVLALPPAAAGAPNVLLIVLDTVRADSLSCYGHRRETTPHIDALAERGVVFDWVLSSSSWTLPAHATMFTGRFHHETTADWKSPLDDSDPTLAEALSAQGYLTGGFIGNLSYCSHVHGVERGFSHYEDYYATVEVIAWHTGIGRRWMPGTRHADKLRNDADVVTDQFLQWLPTDGERPFFAFLNYFDAHALYLRPEGWDNEFGEWHPELPHWYRIATRNRIGIEPFVDAYDALIHYIDHHVQRIVTRLEETGQLDNTLIVVTSDHGEQWGENDIFEHGNSLYTASVRVPLIFYWPERIDPGRVESFASLRDLPKTILDLVDVAPNPPFPGHSLAPHWDPTTGDASTIDTPILCEITKGINTPPLVPVTKGDMKSLIADGMHYIWNRGDGREELYDFRNDLREESNLVEDPRYAEIVKRLRAQLERIPDKPAWTGR